MEVSRQMPSDRLRRKVYKADLRGKIKETLLTRGMNWQVGREMTRDRRKQSEMGKKGE